MGTRAVRFNEKEERAIQDFLKRNPRFDFSTIARTAILGFIEKPKIDLSPTKIKLDKEKTYRRIQ